MRHLRLLSLAVLSLAAIAACSAAAPGWTYAPAPPVTPAPSGAASPAPSGAASDAPSDAASDAPSDAPAPTSDAGVVAISALGIKFEQTAVTAPAGKPFQISFDNKDAGTPHNVAIHVGDIGGAEVFKGEIFNGVATQVYDVPALNAGAYAFVCTVHPTMIGTLNAE